MTPKLTPILTDADTKRGHIRQKVVEGLQESFPIQSRSKILEVDNLQVVEKDYSPHEQKMAILRGDTLSESIKGTIRMKDKNGEVIDEVENFTIARIPWFTPRHTMVVGGNEYSVANQVRPKPGVYARKRANGILEANFNTKGGSNFNVTLDPEKGEPQLEYGTTKIPLYPILREAGVSHERISRHWGARLADQNEKALMPKSKKTIDRLYKKVVPVYHQVADADTTAQIKEVFSRYTQAQMDPEVNSKTLGKPYSNVTPDAILDASDKVLKIFKNPKEVDDRDNLDFKALHSVDDFFKEVISLNARDVARKAAIKMEVSPSLRKALPAGPFTGGILRFINNSQLVSVPTQTNPMELIDSSMRVTSMGEGGIQSDRAIPMEARQIHVTQMGALDPFRTPESFRAGVDIRAAMELKKDQKGNIYVPVRDVKTNKNIHVRAGVLRDKVVAFPNQKLSGTVDALVEGQIRKTPASNVQYQVPHASMMYSPTTNLVPFIESLQGNRAVMGSKMQVQALSLVGREAPMIQVMSPKGKSYEHHMGNLINPVAPVSGTVSKIDENYIYIQPDKVKTSAAGKELVKIPYETDFPLAAKTYLNHDVTVKKGDSVKSGQQMGESNFSKDGVLALGKNLSVAYMPYHGANSNDAVVISEGAAKKLTSERMYTFTIPRDNDMTLNKNKHRVYYGQGYKKNQYSTISADGLVKPGTKILPGDPLMLGLRKSTMTADDLLLGRLHRSLARPYREQSQLWDHDHEGEVIDVVKTPKRVAITVKTKEPMGIGDKLCYTEDTEILTTEGWVPVAEVKHHTTCYTLNTSGGIELHIPTDLHHYPEADELYELETQQVNLRVTPNHNLYIKHRNASSFKLEEARNTIGKRVRHKKDGVWFGSTPVTFQVPTISRKSTGRKPLPLPKIPTKAWCCFLGAYIANGSYIKHARKSRGGSIDYRTQIHTIEGQTHSVSGDQHTWIGEVIAACGFHGQQRKDRYIIASRQLTEYLAPLGHAQDKYIPSVVFSWGVDAAKAMLEGLLGCDGSVTTSNSLSYTTVSKQLADDVQRLALHAGKAANIKITIPDNPNWSTRYDVRIIQKKLHPQVNHGHSSTTKAQSERLVKSKEPVWGITVPNHTLYVRVKGTTVWSGNSGRYGNKGVVSQIVPDAQMIQDESGKVVDILMTSAGVVSRTNPAQIIETAVGKVAEKTGKPIIVENLTGRDNVQWAKDLLKKHNIKDKETLFDPMSGKKLPNVFVGRQFIMKLMKSTDTNYSARGIGSYDVNLQPTKGGVASAKALGKMEFDALIGHNARNILREASTIKSQKNDEYWKAVQLGYPTPPPKASFAYDKFLGMLTGAGVKVNRDSNRLSLAPLTDKSVLDMSSGEIKEPKIIKAKNFTPEAGGLFDPAFTGGLTGSKWSHISLAEPIVSPVFRDPARRLLGLTNPELDKMLEEKGGKYIQQQLAKIDPAQREKEILKSMKNKSANNLDNDVKQVKFLRSLQKQGLRPDEATIITKVPVVPPVFRPILPGRGGQEILYGDINPLYRDLIYTNNQMKEVRKAKILPDEERRLRPTLNAAVGAVYGINDPVTSKSKARGHKGFLTYISGVNSPKQGYFHSKILKKTQDIAGRGTIVPDSTLGMDDVGLPEDMMWTMYDKFLVKKLVQNGYSALQASQMIKDRAPAAKDMLLRESKERPVIINRAPTLHRYSMIGAFPKLVPGKTIRVNPFVEAGTNSDYDGDSADTVITVRVNTPINLSENHRLGDLSTSVDVKSCVSADYGIDNIPSQGYYQINLRDFPRICTEVTVKDNKEIYRVPEGLQVFGFSDEKKCLQLCDVTHFSVHHELKMLMVTTQSGRTVRVSEDDSMFGFNPETCTMERFSALNHPDWAIPRAAKLTCTSDKRITVCQLTLKGKHHHPTKATQDSALVPSVALRDNFGWLLGLIVGDGWVTYQPENRKRVKVPLGQALGLASICKETQERFVHECKRLMQDGNSLKWKLYDNAHTYEGHACKSEKLHIHNSELAHAIGAIFNHRRGAVNKQLPEFFPRAPREFLLGLLAGLIDTDGTVSIVQAKAKNKPQIMVHYTTVSPRLADEVATLGLLLGVKTRVHAAKRKTKVGNTEYQVHFSTPDLQKIALEIPCKVDYKLANLKKLSTWDFSNSAIASKDDRVPLPAQFIPGLKKLVGSSRRKSWKNMQEKEIVPLRKRESIQVIFSKAKRTGKIGRSTLNALIEIHGYTAVGEATSFLWLDLMLNPSIIWDFIDNVEPIEGRHTAWDLTVPDGNTFMTSNQLIVYDTMMVHVPIGNKAVDEAKQMTLSNVLYGDKSRNDLLVFPQHEAIMGIAHAAETDDKNKPKVFKSQKDAMNAYREGKIGLGTRVKIGK